MVDLYRIRVDTWKAWADGQNVGDKQLGGAVRTLGSTKDDRMTTLSQTTLRWAQSAGADIHAMQPPPQIPDRAAPELGLP